MIGLIPGSTPDATQDAAPDSRRRRERPRQTPACWSASVMSGTCVPVTWTNYAASELPVHRFFPTVAYNHPTVSPFQLDRLRVLRGGGVAACVALDRPFVSPVGVCSYSSPSCSWPCHPSGPEARFGPIQQLWPTHHTS